MQRFLDRSGRHDTGRKHDVGQIDGVGAPRLHLVDEVGVSAPQPNVMARVGEMKGEGRSPTARSQNRDRFHALCPILRSMPAKTRLRFDRCRCTTMAATMMAAMTV